jgi:hypothetical protein
VGGLRPIAIVCALLVPSAVVADDLIRVSLSADAVACCAKVKDCASLQGPDACCQTRQQAPGQGFDSSLPDSRVALFSPAVAVVLPSTAAAFQWHDAREAFAALSFKRPHDPPHLHPYNLLI